MKRLDGQGQIRLRVSHANGDPDWDAFLASQAHGHHTQTSLWARVKAQTGWSVTRVVAEHGGAIVGGAQILHRPITGLGRAGYISMGPVLSRTDEGLADEVVQAIRGAARDDRIRLVVVQPPVELAVPVGTASGRGDLSGIGQVAPRATVLVDVSRSPDEVLASMRPSTRYNTRLGARKGVVVREGDGDDIPAYHHMLRATAERQGFSAFPESYYVQMWRILAPGDHVRLTFAECDGEQIAAQLAIVFGRTVVNKLSVWSGKGGERRPNEALQWDTITWAHAAGMERYDLEGIRIEAARALLAGEPLPDRFKDTVTSYKLGFGGAVVVRPEPSLLVSSRWREVAIRHLYPLVQQQAWAKRLQQRIRQGAGGRGRRTEDAGR